MKKIVYALIPMLLLVLVAVGWKEIAAEVGNKSSKEASSLNTQVCADKDDCPKYEIVTTHGTIVVKLYNDTPVHRDNFASLVDEHYYDSTLFYRIVPNFVNQFGDITTRDSSKISLWGEGGKDYTLPAEIHHTHKNGSLAAARHGDDINPERRSAGSDFYFVVDSTRCKHLDGAYTVFGETVSGMDVIRAINQTPTDSLERPMQEARILSIRPFLK